MTVFRSKNGERRTIPINSLVFDVLKRKAKVRSVKSGYVFPSDTDTLLDDSHLRRAFRGVMSCAVSKISISMISGIPLPQDLCNQALISTRSKSVRAQVADHDPALCASLSGESARGSGNAREVPSGEHRGHKFSAHGTNGRAGTRQYQCKWLKNLVGRVGVEPTAR